ncbi:hypothetical protein [Streptomyces niveus]|uniref:hypothetical protein n=1 Tax=Streptomyces niveus TaxID=193462 RepID=UPI00364FC69C
MDAGLAAICGALAGAVATTGAALATGWSQRESARIAARAEYQRQRHESRHAAYKRFISITQTLNDETRFLRTLGNSSQHDFSQEFADRCSALEQEVKEVWMEIVLAGPVEAGAAAGKVMTCATSIKHMTKILCIAQSTQPQTQIATNEILHTVFRMGADASDQMPKVTGEFIDAAQRSLANDGAG